MAKKDEQTGGETSIAKVDDILSGLLASPDEGDVDITDLPDPSVAPTENEKSIVDIRIVQKMSKISDTLPIGDIYASTGQHLGKKVIAIFLWSKRSADLLDKDTMRSVCSSRDGVMGKLQRQDVSIKGVNYRIGGECTSCQAYYDGWDEARALGLKSPLCSKSMVYPAIIVGSDLVDGEGCKQLGLVVFKFKRTSTGVGKVINTYCAGRPKYLFAFELTTLVDNKGIQPTNIWSARPLGRVSKEWIDIGKGLVDLYGKLDLDTNESGPTAGTAVVPDEDGEGSLIDSIM